MLNVSSKNNPLVEAASPSLDDNAILGALRMDGVVMPLPPGSIVKFVDVVRFRYNFFSSNRHLSELFDIKQSYRPNASIESLTNSIISSLPQSFIAIHLRVEPDKADFHDKGNFSATLEKHLESLTTAAKTSLWGPNGLQDIVLNRTAGGELPALFVASGIFRHHNDNDSPVMTHRAKATIASLHSAGFKKIYTRIDIAGDFYKEFGHLTAEQQAMVDFLICIRSPYFLPSIIETSFSWLIVRHRQMNKSALTLVDQKIPSLPTDFGYKWGF